MQVWPHYRVPARACWHCAVPDNTHNVARKASLRLINPTQRACSARLASARSTKARSSLTRGARIATVARGREEVRGIIGILAMRERS